MAETTVSGWNPVALRLALGVIIFVHGIGKLLDVGPASPGIEGFTGYLANLMVPYPELFAWIVALVETVGGILVFIGLFARYASALIVIDMAAATWLVHIPNGLVASGGELPIVLGLIGIAIVLSGPGHLSIERAVFGRELVPGGGRRRDSTTAE
jgi:putative oxidoreductase